MKLLRECTSKKRAYSLVGMVVGVKRALVVLVIEDSMRVNAVREHSVVTENHVDPLANLCPDDWSEVPHPLGLGDGGGEAPVGVLDIHGLAVNLPDAVIPLLAKNWRVRGLLHGHPVEQVEVGGQVIPLNLLSCKRGVDLKIFFKNNLIQ